MLLKRLKKSSAKVRWKGIILSLSIRHAFGFENLSKVGD